MIPRLPTAVRTIELGAPLERLLLGSSRRGAPYGRALLLARRDGEHVGVLEVEADRAGMIGAAALEAALDEQLPGWRSGPEWHGVPGPEAVAPHVTVVVPARGRSEALEACLASILESDWPCFDIVVVDSSPRSGVAELLRQRFGAEARLRCLAEPGAGSGRARNAGLAAARGEIVAFACDDVVVDRGWITALVDSLADSGAACATGLVMPLELDTPGQVLIEQLTGFDLHAGPRTLSAADGSPKERLGWWSRGRLGSAANLAVRADVARSLGGFDPALGAGTPTRGGEELDLFMRLLREGHSLSYDPRALVWRRHPDLLADARREAIGRGVALGATIAKLTRRNRVPLGARRLLRRIEPGRSAETRRNAALAQSLQLTGLIAGPSAYRQSAAAQSRLPAPAAAPTVVFDPASERAAEPEPVTAPAQAAAMARPRAPRWLDAALVGLVAAAAAVSLAPAPLAARVVVMLVAACLVPGGALARHLRLDLGVSWLAMAACLSFAVEIAGSLALVWSGWWHPAALAIALGAASILLIVVDQARNRPAPARSA